MIAWTSLSAIMTRFTHPKNSTYRAPNQVAGSTTVAMFVVAVAEQTSLTVGQSRNHKKVVSQLAVSFVADRRSSVICTILSLSSISILWELTAVFGRGISGREPWRLFRPLRDVLETEMRFERELDPKGELISYVLRPRALIGAVQTLVVVRIGT